MVVKKSTEFRKNISWLLKFSQSFAGDDGPLAYSRLQYKVNREFLRIGLDDTTAEE
jgi:hypothetical protein